MNHRGHQLPQGPGRDSVGAERLRSTVKKSIKRALSQGLATALVLAGLGAAMGGPASATVPPPPPPPAPIYGTAGFNYTGVGNPPTADKPQSKLWWNDGSWWADMWTSGGWKIHKLDRAAKQWVDTGVGVDSRASTSADTLWDGTHLYIAHHVVTISTEDGPKASRPDSPARLYRYSYDNGKYTRSSGFPTTITTNSSESMTIDKDSTGAIWATWTQVSGVPTGGYTSAVMVNNSAAGGTSWGTPQSLSGESAAVAPDDISSIVAFGKNKIGVMWSDHTTGSVWWATRTDGQANTSWKVQSAVRGPNQADDHLNIKSLQADDSGRVFAAVKTSFDMNSTAKNSDPQLQLLVFKPATAAFDKYTISTIGECHTRPQIVLDPENNKIHAFQSGPATTVTGCPYSGVSGAIYQKTASLDNPVFPAGRGTPVIQDATPSVNNVTTTKQAVTRASGVVVLASDNEEGRYWFADSGGTTEEETYTVEGPIGEKYATVSDLVGLPIANEVKDQRFDGSYQKFERGTIAYMPDSGAFAVANGISTVWNSIGAHNGDLGYPTSDEYSPMAGGVMQDFQFGKISWNAATGSRITKGGIGATWDNAGGPLSGLGYPTTDEYAPMAGGVMQGFQYGKISWTAATGSRITKGGIGATWDKVGGPLSGLGYPTTDEYATANGGVTQAFQYGQIVWSPSTGARFIKGGIGQVWINAGGPNSGLGYPTSDEISGLVRGGAKQYFQGGEIVWSSAAGARIITGGIRTAWVGQGSESGRLGYPTTNEYAASGGGRAQDYQGGRIIWRSGSVSIEYAAAA